MFELIASVDCWGRRQGQQCIIISAAVPPDDVPGASKVRAPSAVVRGQNASRDRAIDAVSDGRNVCSYSLTARIHPRFSPPPYRPLSVDMKRLDEDRHADYKLSVIC